MQAETPGPEDIPEQEQVQEAELEKLAARTRRSLINRLNCLLYTSPSPRDRG